MAFSSLPITGRTDGSIANALQAGFHIEFSGFANHAESTFADAITTLCNMFSLIPFFNVVLRDHEGRVVAEIDAILFSADFCAGLWIEYKRYLSGQRSVHFNSLVRQIVRQREIAERYGLSHIMLYSLADVTQFHNVLPAYLNSILIDSRHDDVTELCRVLQPLVEHLSWKFDPDAMDIEVDESLASPVILSPRNVTGFAFKTVC